MQRILTYAIFVSWKHVDIGNVLLK